MNKKRLFKVMTKADGALVARLADNIKEHHQIVVIKPPNKTLAMIKIREPVKSSLFYIGEVMVTEAVIEFDGVTGLAVTMGDDFEKALNMAIIDGACNKGVFKEEHLLLELEKAQMDREQKENAMHLKTMVSFTSMDQEAPK